MHANTTGAAYQIRHDQKVGSVEIDPHDIHRATITTTMMNGQVRHQV